MLGWKRLWSRDFAHSAPEERLALMDPGARAILKHLTRAGYEAYAVGGCVRDLAMGIAPHDWDVTTSARPEETAHVLTSAGIHTVDGAGRRFGTVVAVVNGKNYEVTTFRSESYGADSHRPETIRFGTSLQEDLVRRDFTVNAMALDGEGRITDPFGGLKDIANKRLRTVGAAEERFKEDALRLFRACRFLGQLDFMAEPSLVAGMKPAFSRVSGLSLERVKSEVERLLVTDHAGRGLDLLVRSGLAECTCRVREHGRDEAIAILPELSHLVGLPQMKAFHKYDGWYHTLAVVEAAPAERITRWAALLHDVGKGMPGVRHVEGEKITDYNHDSVGEAMAEVLLMRWRYPAREVHLISWLVANHMKFHYFANVEKADVVKWVRHLAMEKAFPSQTALIDAIGKLTALCQADIIGCGRPLSATEGHGAFGRCMADVAASIPIATSELCLERRTIEALRPQVAPGLRNLLTRVQSGSLRNTPEALYQAALRYGKRHGR